MFLSCLWQLWEASLLAFGESLRNPDFLIIHGTFGKLSKVQRSFAAVCTISCSSWLLLVSVVTVSSRASSSFSDCVPRLARHRIPLNFFSSKVYILHFFLTLPSLPELNWTRYPNLLTFPQGPGSQALPTMKYLGTTFTAVVCVALSTVLFSVVRLVPIPSNG